MGAVYLAEQREPIRRSVALKVIKVGMDTSQVLARFANERQALAMMDHPNIARIFDAGATSKGRPYFVMEYIEGAPITLYCDRVRMTVSDRLQLFLAVCRAVQHAHHKGVIHRDLKPSNVLVKDQEGAPLPKVIDFGIAKATDQWAVENTLLTQFGQMVGTPEYASPEQAEFIPGAVDERSDVYSLGVLLYELLIGALPFDTASIRRAGLGEMLRVIREEGPPPLADKLNSMGGAAGDIAARRQTDLASLRRLAEGDLHWITLKALEKAPELRYQSAAELEAELRRYLEHRPVRATPPGVLHRARRFLRRHRPAILGRSAPVIFSPAGHRNSPPEAVPTERIPLVLGEFVNSTGDAAFDRLRPMLAAELRKSPRLTVLSETRVRETLRLMVQTADAKITPEIASEICQRTGAAAAVDGWIAGVGNQYVVALRCRDGQMGDVLAEEQATVTRKRDVIEALGQIADRFRMAVGETLSNIEKQSGVSAHVTTPSLEAWKSYNAGMKVALGKGAPAEAVPLFKRAIEVDPEFAMAHAALGRIYDALGETEPAATSISTAYALRGRVSAPENFFITFNYYRQVSRNLELARQTLESWAQQYPDDPLPHSLLSGLTSPGTGHHERAVEEGQKAIALDPKLSIAYYNAAFACLYLDRLPEAEALLEQASQRQIEAVEMSLCRYFIAFLRNDSSALHAEVARRRAKLQAQGWFEHQEALTSAYHGRLKEAQRLSDSAVALARQAGLRQRAAQFEGARSVWNALFGYAADALESAKAALAQYRSRDADYGPAFALAYLHERVDARRIAADLHERYPEDTCVQFSYLPALYGLDALNEGDATKAIQATAAAAPYEFAVPSTAYVSGGFFGALYPVYVRGLAYLRLGSHREAATEFRKIVSRPGITLNDPIGPIARLQLARALAGSGDRAGATAVFNALLAIWADADSDIPVVQEARAEVATVDGRV